MPGRAGAVAPWQSGPIAAKVGVTEFVTSTFNVAVEAHCPAAGVKVYVVVPIAAVLIVAGFQVPVVPLDDMPGSNGAVAPWQSGPIAAKVGVTEFVTSTFNVAVEAHCPAEGVMVYVVVPIAAVLIVAGFQVPVVPLDDMPGSAGAIAP